MSDRVKMAWGQECYDTNTPMVNKIGKRTYRAISCNTLKDGKDIGKSNSNTQTD